MAKSLIIANWKCNPDSPGRAVILARKIQRGITGFRDVEIVIAPPFPFLLPIAKVLKKAKLGAQDAFWEDVGPQTGEVSWHQLKHLGVQYVILGHSERRIRGETDGLINKKVKSVLEHGQNAVLCIGERELEGSEIPATVGEQLRNALKNIKGSHIKNLIVAYEPVWAISTMPGARPDTPDNAFRAKVYIKRVLTKLYGGRVAARVRVIYGGSVDEKNVASFLGDGKMEGALVGGASLRPDEFIRVVKNSARVR